MPAGPNQPIDQAEIADGPLDHYCPTAADHAVWYASCGYNSKLATFIIWGEENTPVPTGSQLDTVK